MRSFFKIISFLLIQKIRTFIISILWQSPPHTPHSSLLPYSWKSCHTPPFSHAIPCAKSQTILEIYLPKSAYVSGISLHHFAATPPPLNAIRSAKSHILDLQTCKMFWISTIRSATPPSHITCMSTSSIYDIISKFFSGFFTGFAIRFLDHLQHFFNFSPHRPLHDPIQSSLT